MTKHLVTLLTITAIAACGGSKSSPTAPTAKPAEGTTSSDPVVAAPEPKPTTPEPKPTPDLPTKPAEPAKADLGKQKTDLMAAETAAYDKAKPVFEKYCSSCHTKGGKKATKKKLDHLTMDTYPFGGEHAKSIGNEIRVVLAIDGHKKATMPFDKPGSVKGDDLALIKAWTEAWQASGQAGNHPADPADKDDD